MHVPGQSILVIDDQTTILAAIKNRLADVDGYQVMIAEGGEAGLKLARQNKPDLILLDWVMPGMTGLGVLQDLKTNSATKGISVYMLTTLGKMGNVEDAFEIGADGYITKPIKMPELSERVKEIFGSLTDGATS